MAPPLRAPKGGETGVGAVAAFWSNSNQGRVQVSNIIWSQPIRQTLSPLSTPSSPLSWQLHYLSTVSITSIRIHNVQLSRTAQGLWHRTFLLLSPTPPKTTPHNDIPLQTRGEAVASCGLLSRGIGNAASSSMGESQQLALVFLSNCLEHMLTIDFLANNRLSFLTLVIIPALSAQLWFVPAQLTISLIGDFAG